MGLILDSTSGNRSMWKNKNLDFVIFIDREIKLKVPPNVFADNRFCPFRDDVFECVIYDPPYYIRFEDESTVKWIFYNPEMKKHPLYKTTTSHYGYYKTKIELFSNLFKASREFLRISKRLSFQWGEGAFPIHKIIPFFKPWEEVYRIKKKSRGYEKKKDVYWICFINPFKKVGALALDCSPRIPYV